MKSSAKVLLALPSLLLTGCFSSNIHQDKEKYSEYLKTAIEYNDFHSELYIFPQEIEQEEIKTLTYETRDSLFNGSYFFYLVAQYDQTKFSAEINRLDNIKSTFKNGKTKSILKYEEQSLYLTINRDHRYEYVKYNETTFEIAYISNQLYEWNDIEISDNYQMGEVIIPEEIDDGGNSYNLYYSYEGDVGLYVKD